MRKWITSFGWARHGLYTVWQEEANFRIDVFFAFAVVALAIYFKFTQIEWIVAVACMTIVLSGEIVNTVIEDLCNKIEPRQDPAIGKIKDMAAGFILLAATGAGIIGVFLFLPHFLALL